MASLRAAAACIGFSGNFSVLGDFFGYVTIPAPLSVLTQVRRLQHKRIHIDLIRVGIESFGATEERKIDAAVQFTRDTYATVSLAIGRVRRFFMTLDEADGFEHIADDCEAMDLFDEWNACGHAIDVFFVLSWSGTTNGGSPTDGACERDGKPFDGLVISVEASFNITSMTMAHELGHYLGLPHVTSDKNLMFESAEHTFLSANQGQIMRSHCTVRPPC